MGCFSLRLPFGSNLTSAPTAGVEGLLEPNHKSAHNNTPLPILLHMSTTLHVSTTSEVPRKFKG